MKKTIIKGVTLTLFISLIGSFVLYRSGVFGTRTASYSMSPNGSVINSSTDQSESATDSIAKQPIMISSSKFIIIKDPIVQLKDTTKTSNSTNFIIRRKGLMSGSKSGRMLDSDDMVKMFKDSLQVDSLKNKNNE